MMRTRLVLASLILLTSCSPGTTGNAPVAPTALAARPPQNVAATPQARRHEPAPAQVASAPAIPENRRATAEPFVVHVVDLGTGLGVFVQGPDFTLVYDAGSNDDCSGGDKNRFAAYLRAVNPELTALDHVIIGHPHKDHIELLPDVLESYSVGNLWDSGAKTGVCTYEKLIRIVHDKQIAYRSATQDAGRHYVKFAKACRDLKERYLIEHGGRIEPALTVPLGEKASMTFLYSNPQTEKDPNDNSLVVRLDLGSTRVLLMGDAGGGGRDDPKKPPKPNSVEGILLQANPEDLKAHVLVVGHHGSKTSSRSSFVDAVAPAISVISSGPKKYGTVTLPDPEVLKVLKTHGEVFRTDRDDDACANSNAKIGPDEDGKPGGCDNVRISIGTDGPRAEYWTQTD